jgi:hypothetical protein
VHPLLSGLAAGQFARKQLRLYLHLYSKANLSAAVVRHEIMAWLCSRRSRLHASSRRRGYYGLFDNATSDGVEPQRHRHRQRGVGVGGVGGAKYWGSYATQVAGSDLSDVANILCLRRTYYV